MDQPAGERRRLDPHVGIAAVRVVTAPCEFEVRIDVAGPRGGDGFEGGVVEPGGVENRGPIDGPAGFANPCEEERGD